jgi:hypothetical protein
MLKHDEHGLRLSQRILRLLHRSQLRRGTGSVIERIAALLNGVDLGWSKLRLAELKSK